MARSLNIGFDFDNTIVCYDGAIEVLSKEIVDLPDGKKRTKLNVREQLRREGREHEWTEFQGILYGPGICKAKPFDGVVETMKKLIDQGHHLYIVSHKTKFPYSGRKHDLHAYAKQWVEMQLCKEGLFPSKNKYREEIFFIESLDGKVKKIADLGLDIFIDDLQSVIEHEHFPLKTLGVLFAPDTHREYNFKKGKRYPRVDKWHQFCSLVKKLPRIAND